MAAEDFRIGHLDDLDWPWANAGGVVRSLEEVEAMAKVGGTGWIEAGSYTLEERFGNDHDKEGKPLLDPGSGRILKVYDHNKETGLTTNSLGMPNRGMDEVVEQIPEMNRIAKAHRKRLIINVAPVSEDPVAEAQELVTRAYEAGAEAVLVNFGCPNVLSEDGSRHEVLSYHPREMFMVLSGLSEIVKKHPKVFVRTSPYPSYDKAKIAYRNIEWAHTASAIWTPNSWPVKPGDETPLDVGGGGVSGPGKAEQAQVQTKWALEILNGSKIDVVSSSSVMNAVHLRTRLDLGAVAAAGTTFFYESRDWNQDVDRMMRSFINL